MLDPQEIRRIPRFSGISPRAEQWLGERLRVEKYGKGKPVFFEGDESTRFTIVLSGEVKVFKVLESGRELILDIFRNGESFGEVAMVDGGEYPASAEAMEDTILATLTRQEYLDLLEQFPEVARSIIRDLILRVHAMRRRVEVLGEGAVASRIAHLFQVYARQLGRECPRGVLIPIHLSRNEVASLVNARIETVIRIMSRWQKECILVSEPGGFVVKDLATLQALVKEEG